MVIGLIKLYFFVIMEGGITVYYKQKIVELVGISRWNGDVLTPNGLIIPIWRWIEIKYNIVDIILIKDWDW